MTLAAGLTACAGMPGHVAPSHLPTWRPPAFVEDCHQYLATALTALTVPLDSTPSAPSPAHVHALAMHEYHMCLGRAAAALAEPQAP